MKQRRRDPGRRSGAAARPDAAGSRKPSAASPTPLPQANRLASLSVAALALAAYSNTLGHGFVWDDPISLQRWLPALATIWDAFFPPPNIPQFPTDYYRPLQLLSYRVDRAIGGGEPWAFHLSVVLLHALATLLVLRTARWLLAAQRTPIDAPWWAAALFAVHPIHSESVAWMAARPDVMVTCAGLGALLLYTDPRKPPLLRATLAATLIFVGLLCKENAAALLLLVPASLFVVSPDREHETTPPTATVALHTYLPFAVAGLAYMWLRAHGLPQALPSQPILPEDWLGALLIAPGTYLRLLLLPYPQNAYIADLPSGRMPLVSSIVLLSGAVLLCLWAWRARQRSLLFALAWLGLTLAPSLAVILQPPTAPLAERYLYLPSVGLCWLAAALAARAAAHNEKARKATITGLSALILTCFALTLHRNSVWYDNLSLWSDSAAKNPVEGLPHRNLATALLEAGEAARAEELFYEALQRRNSPRGLFGIYNNLGTLALNRNDDETAERHYQKALSYSSSADCLYNLGLIALRRGLRSGQQHEEAARHVHTARSYFEHALSLSPHDADIHVAMGQTAQELGERTRARRHFEEALRLGLPEPTTKAVHGLITQLDAP